MVTKKSFTLTELLISISIIVLLSGVFLAEYQRGESTRNLNDTSQELVQNIRRMQSAALTEEKFKEEIPLYGYGLVFIEAPTWYSQYRLFANTNGDSEEHKKKYDTSDKEIEIVKLSSGITMIGLNVEFDKGIFIDGSSQTEAHFVVHPNGNIYINGDSINDGKELKIKLYWRDTTKTVTVTNKGLVEIE
jgi:type II secretory pathway pseudopilin PulG